MDERRTEKLSELLYAMFPERINEIQKAEKELKSEIRELQDILSDSLKYKMANCDMQAELAVNLFNKIQKDRRFPGFIMEAKVTKTLFKKSQHTVGLVLVKKDDHKGIIAEIIIMDPWLGYCSNSRRIYDNGL